MVYSCPDKAVDLYADDSTLHKSGTNINDIQNRLQNDYNNMALHPGKSKCMLIGPPSKLRQLGELRLQINGQKLETVKHKTVLGLHIDNHLNWKEQVNTICKRLNSTIAFLNRINYYLCPEMKTMFYNSNFMSISDYCCFIWGKRKDCSHKITKNLPPEIFETHPFELLLNLYSRN